MKLSIGKQIFCSSVALALCATPALSKDCSFSWLPNDEPTLAGYKIVYGPASRKYTQVIDVGNPATINGRVHATIFNLPPHIPNYFAAKAYDIYGNESGVSENEPICPPPPPQFLLLKLAGMNP